MEFKDRLRSARMRAGLSMAQLGANLRTRVSPQSINKYEKGEMMPSSSTLYDLSLALNVSLDFLMKGDVLELAGVEFRKRASLSDEDKRTITQEVLDFAEKCVAIESVLGEDEVRTGLDDVEPMSIDTIEDAEDVADEIRRKFAFGDGPIQSITNALELHNIRVCEVQGAEGFSGLTCRVVRGEKPSIPVVVRRAIGVERDRFTTAHEVAHAFIGECKNGKLEKAIDRCAGALLVPAKHFKEEVGSKRGMISYAELLRVKHTYAVSAAAIVLRLKDLKIISDADYRNMFRNPRTRSWLNSEPAPLEPDGETAERERPRRFEEQVYRALSEGMIRSDRAAKLLGKQIEVVEQAVWGPEVVPA